MGLDDFLQNSSEVKKNKAYRDNGYNSELEDIVDGYRDRFPIDLNIDFIESSPRMTSKRGMAYRRPGGIYFIRISEDFIDTSTDEELKRTVLHEMCHVYMYQQGFPDHQHSKHFRWVAGRVGASLTYDSINSSEWTNSIQPFIENDDI